MNENLLQELKDKEKNYKESIVKVRGALETTKDQVRNIEALLFELQGRLSEVMEIIKRST